MLNPLFPGQQKTRRSGFFWPHRILPAALLAVVDHPDPEHILRFRMGID